ncbi:MAG: hypothetical protein GKR91_18945 [Pseudomonadales bacterium]|nr:hypothetical protein [Pseudomonadales bacterium]
MNRVQNRKIRNRLIVLVSCLVLLSNCSNRAIYESLRRANLQECEQQPIALIEACQESNRMSYDEYRRELERLAIEQRQAN